MSVIAATQYEILDVNDIYVGALPPATPVEDALWLDVSVSPSQLKCWNGTSWDIVDDQTDLINAIEAVQDQVDGLSVGGANLLDGTSDNPTTITASTSLAALDLSAYKNAWDGWMTFRAKLSPVSGTWKLRLKFTATSAAQATLGHLVLGSGVTDVTADEVINIDSDTCTTEQWLTITTQVQSTNFIIEPQIILVSNSGETEYAYPKFELGNLATQWQPSTEDINSYIESVRSDAHYYVDMKESELESHINMMVTKTEYNARDEEIRSSISALSLNNQNISADVATHDALLGDLGTHIIIDSQSGLTLRQDQNATYEAVLASDSLSFKQTGANGTVAAMFGVSGGYVDRLRSNETLSVGSETQGWYDMTQLTHGVADKWRNGTGGPPNKAVIQQEPINYYGTSSATFTATGEDCTNYQWQIRERSNEGIWNDISGATQASYSTSLSSAVSHEYRCKVSNSNSGSVAYSRAVCAFNTAGPTVICDIPESVVKGSGAVTLSVYASGTPTYQWKDSSNLSSWSNVAGETSQSISVSPSATKYYRCELTENSNTASTRVCKVTVN